MLLPFVRVIKFSFQDIARNIWLSLVTVIILILALFTVNMLLVVQVIGQTAVEAVKDKIDINLYLDPEAPEDRIMALKARVQSLDEVDQVTYVSKSEALSRFQSKYQNSPELLEILRELGKNPLTPTLVIKPEGLDRFDNLINKLNSIDEDIIESRNFTNYEAMLAKINSITEKVSEAGIVLSSIFVFITILVIYNSVRVAIYTHRTEIAVMRLVGASNSFITMPFLMSALIYTLIGVAAIMLIFFPFLSLLQPYLETFFVGYDSDIFNYFYMNAWQIFGLQFLGAATINILASLLAVRKYSQV
jgi:cell division transport system permease protein